MDGTASAKYVWAVVAVVLAAFAAMMLVVAVQPDDKVVDEAGVVVGFATVVVFQLFGIIRTLENSVVIARTVEQQQQTHQVVTAVQKSINGQQAILVEAARAAGRAEGPAAPIAGAASGPTSPDAQLRALAGGQGTADKETHGPL